MNQENVNKVIAALRSDKYEQTAGALRRSGTKGGHCCLGVACDISGLGTWEKRHDAWYYVIKDENGVTIADADGVMPNPVARWLGIEESGEFNIPVTDPANSEVRYGTKEADRATSTRTGLAELNDNGLTFAQIADILENAAVFEWASPEKAPLFGDNDNDLID